MNYGRIALAAVGGFAVYFVMGGVLFGALSWLRTEFQKNQRCTGHRKGSRARCPSACLRVFAVGSFVAHNYVNLNIGLKLTAEQAVAYFFEWLAVGLVIEMIYRPAR
jgi:hypothetical protein